MKTLSFILFQFLFIHFAFNQATVKGVIQDADKEMLTGATVVMLHAADSTLAGFDISDQAGKFEIPRMPIGTYLLQITYIGYGTFSQNLQITDDQTIDMEEIWLSTENQLLEEVVVKAEHIPISIHNDTIQYNSDAFKVKPNSPVEDLLRRLPGIEIERDGTIRAHGKRVNTIMVDGKEFFGSNPQIATQNLPADAVEAVQVYDKKSEMAEFSGIDDGQRDKTINLKLKADKKKGVFGHIEAGGGTDERYQGKLSANKFNSNLQFSAIANGNNINQPGFDVEDYINFMGGIRNLMSGGGRIEIGGSDLGASSLFGADQGITRTIAGGLNFNYNFSRKTELQSSYFVNNINNKINSIVDQEYINQNTIFNSSNTIDQLGKSTGHRLQARLRHKIDSTQELSVQLRAGLIDGSVNHNSTSQHSSFEGLTLSNSHQRQFTDQDRYDLVSNINYRKRLNTKGRLWTTSIGLGLDEDQFEGINTSTNSIFDATGTLQSTMGIHQIQPASDLHKNYSVNLSYTEPLAHLLFGQIGFSRNADRTDRKKSFFDINGSGEQQLNPTLSNTYRLDQVRNQVDISLIRNREKSRFSMALAGQWTQLTGSNSDIYNKTQYRHLLPRLRWQHDLTQSNSIEARYRTYIQVPSIDEFQPIIDNQDPLNIYQGNPALRPSYIHELESRLSLIDRFSFTNFFINASAGYISNNIIYAQSIDDNFRRTTQPINLNSAWLAGLSANYSTPIRRLKSKINIGLSTQFKQESVQVNSQTYEINRYNVRPRISLENRKKKKIDWQLGVQLNWNKSIFADDQLPGQKYLQWSYFSRNTIYLTDKWTLETDLTYNRYSGEAFAQSQQYVQWNAGVSRSFMSNNRLTLELSVNDLLDQNKGIKRQSDLNFTEEVRYNILGRYGMLTAKYNLSKLSKADSGISIRVNGQEQ